MTICTSCNDTHVMPFGEERRAVPCTRCPVPCRKCAGCGGRGAYCAETPCSCACHAVASEPVPVAAPTPGLEMLRGLHSDASKLHQLLGARDALLQREESLALDIRNGLADAMKAVRPAQSEPAEPVATQPDSRDKRIAELESVLTDALSEYFETDWTERASRLLGRRASPSPSEYQARIAELEAQLAERNRDLASRLGKLHTVSATLELVEAERDRLQARVAELNDVLSATRDLEENLDALRTQLSASEKERVFQVERAQIWIKTSEELQSEVNTLTQRAAEDRVDLEAWRFGRMHGELLAEWCSVPAATPTEKRTAQSYLASLPKPRAAQPEPATSEATPAEPHAEGQAPCERGMEGQARRCFMDRAVCGAAQQNLPPMCSPCSILWLDSLHPPVAYAPAPGAYPPPDVQHRAISDAARLLGLLDLAELGATARNAVQRALAALAEANHFRHAMVTTPEAARERTKL